MVGKIAGLCFAFSTFIAGEQAYTAACMMHKTGQDVLRAVTAVPLACLAYIGLLSVRVMLRSEQST